MKWALQKYTQSFIADYKSLQSMSLIMPLVVDPRLWTPMNIFAEFKMVPLQCPHSGFLFRTNGHVINQMSRHYLIDFQTLPNNTNVVVKYLSALLTLDYERVAGKINLLLEREADLKLNAVLLAERKPHRTSTRGLLLSLALTRPRACAARRAAPRVRPRFRIPTGINPTSLDQTRTARPNTAKRRRVSPRVSLRAPPLRAPARPPRADARRRRTAGSRRRRRRAPRRRRRPRALSPPAPPPPPPPPRLLR